MATSDPDRLTRDEAAAAVEVFVRTKLFLRRGLARRLLEQPLELTGALHVVLESFVERREVVFKRRPYRGGSVDGPDGTPPPDPWAIIVPTPDPFTAGEADVDVPRTQVVSTCATCDGAGEVSCSRCSGSGSVSCSRCGGFGSISASRTITETDASGVVSTRTESYSESCDRSETCSGCSGRGEVTCSTCRGAGRVVHLEVLEVRWTVPRGDRVLEDTQLPDRLIRAATGTPVLREEADRLEPIMDDGGVFRGREVRCSPQVNEAVNELLVEQRFSGAEKALRQRLLVLAMPVYETRYSWKGEPRQLWIYGLDRRVHAPFYPRSRIRQLAAMLVMIGLAAAVIALIAHGCGG